MMFSPAGHFREIECPLSMQCDLPKCIFLHIQEERKRSTEQISSAEPKKQGERAEIANKRLKLSRDQERTGNQPIKDIEVSTPRSSPDESSEGELFGEEIQHQTAALVHGSNPKRHMASRPISPPLIKRSTKVPVQPNGQISLPETVKHVKESLNPRMMASAPAPHSTRSVYLKKLHEIFTRLNNLPADKSELHLTKLSEAQLVTLALDEEEKFAQDNPTVYTNVIKLRMVALSKWTFVEWKNARLNGDVGAKAAVGFKLTAKSTSDSAVESGLSNKEELQVLQHLFAAEKNLKRHGYITAPPTKQEVDSAIEGVDAAMGWEQCDRCKARFQVFPERREDGSITSGGPCAYHQGRVMFSGIKGSADKFYSCCNEPVGTSVGCVTADTHVFKIGDPKRLASILQFQSTPANPHPRPAICFDCEMGYTINGMEMIRLTALSWPEGDILLDVLVKTLGTTLDFNTRWSGVRAEDFANAVAYGNPLCERSEQPSLQVVDSPMAARKLLFDLISPSTALIGHALENDLSVTRIIHPNIVDTVILFPHKHGLPKRPSLKILAKDFLSRDIQSQTVGHDSKEDAKATGDLVRVKVKRLWREMQHDGWEFKDGKLTPRPQGQAEKIAVPKQNELLKRSRE